MTGVLDRLSAEDLALTILGITGALLFGALVMEHRFDMAPCPLCLMQRLWFLAAGTFALIGLLHDPRWGIYPLLTLLSALTGAGFAIRQLYLQSLPPGEAPACGAPVDYLLAQSRFGDLLAAMTSGTGDCAEVSWRFLGLSLPAWALLGFVALAALAVMQLRAGNKP